MKELVLYMYTDELRCTPEIMESMSEALFCAACKYQVIGMIRLCEDYLSQQITIDNFLTLLQLGDTYSSKKLKQQCLHFISQNVHAVISNKDYVAFKLERKVTQNKNNTNI